METVRKWKKLQRTKVSWGKAEGNSVDIEWRYHANRSIQAVQSCLVTSMEGSAGLLNKGLLSVLNSVPSQTR